MHNLNVTKNYTNYKHSPISFYNLNVTQDYNSCKDLFSRDYFLLHPELISLTNRTELAAILSLFLYWTENTNDTCGKDFFQEEFNNAKDSSSHIEKGWIEKSLQTITNSLFVTKSTSAMSRTLNALEKSGWIYSKTSPNRKNCRQYRLNLIKIMSDLQATPQALISLCNKKSLQNFIPLFLPQYQNIQLLPKTKNQYFFCQQPLVELTQSMDVAIILSALIFYTGIKQDRQLYIAEEKNNLKNTNIHNRIHGWNPLNLKGINNLVKMNRSRTTISRTMNNLVQLGYIDVRRQEKRKPNQYRVNIAKIAHSLIEKNKSVSSIKSLNSQLELFREITSSFIESVNQNHNQHNSISSPLHNQDRLQSRNNVVAPAVQALCKNEPILLQKRDTIINNNIINNKVIGIGTNTARTKETKPPLKSENLLLSSKNNYTRDELSKIAKEKYLWEDNFVLYELEKFQQYNIEKSRISNLTSRFCWERWCERVSSTDKKIWTQNNHKKQAEPTQYQSEIEYRSRIIKKWGELYNFALDAFGLLSGGTFNSLTNSINEIKTEDKNDFLQIDIISDWNKFKFDNIPYNSWFFFLEYISKNHKKLICLTLKNSMNDHFINFSSDYIPEEKLWPEPLIDCLKTLSKDQNEKFNFFQNNIDSVIFDERNELNTIIINNESMIYGIETFSDDLWQEFLHVVNHKLGTDKEYLLVLQNKSQVRKISINPSATLKTINNKFPSLQKIIKRITSERLKLNLFFQCIEDVKFDICKNEEIIRDLINSSYTRMKQRLTEFNISNADINSKFSIGDLLNGLGKEF